MLVSQDNVHSQRLGLTGTGCRQEDTKSASRPNNNGANVECWPHLFGTDGRSLTARVQVSAATWEVLRLSLAAISSVDPLRAHTATAKRRDRATLHAPALRPRSSHSHVGFVSNKLNVK